MTQNSSEYSYTDLLAQGRLCQMELFEVYKSSIGLINDLKNRSKRYMILLSDIEDGLLGSKSGDEDLSSNLKFLTKDVESFNENIGEKCDDFTAIFDKMIDFYNQGFKKYQGNEGELSKALEVRKQLFFLIALIRKYKYKITSLQLMNNALMSLSSELDQAKDAYKSNLIQLSTAMTSAIEDAEDMIDQIENLN